ncbi:MAG: TlpA disulfide reductase family protein [Woeseia sp.]
MKGVKIRLLIAAILGFTAHGIYADVNVGKPAPDMALEFIDGSVGSLSEWLGKKPIYLKVWATWCSTCRDEMPHFQASYEKYHDDVAVFAVNAGFNDTVPDVLAFNEQYGLTMPSVIDATGAIGQAFNLTATPYHILIDSQGVVVHLGHVANDIVDRKLNVIARGASNKPPQRQVKFPIVQKPDGTAPQPGDKAPAFSIETLSGDHFTVDSEEKNEEPVYLFFFTVWCESYLGGDGDDETTAKECRETHETLATAYSKPKHRPNVIGIASRMWTSQQDIVNYQNRVGKSYPLALDKSNETFQLFGVRRFPTLIVVSNGQVSGRYEGGVTELPRR